jgi:hypothetical protein
MTIWHAGYLRLHKHTHTHTHTLRLLNTDCFSTATVVARMRLNVTYRRHVLPLFRLIFLRADFTVAILNTDAAFTSEMSEKTYTTRFKTLSRSKFQAFFSLRD